MKVLTFVIVCFVSFQCIAGHASKKTVMFNSIRKCAKESGVDFKTITNYLKGNFSNESKPAKCFLTCVANDMEFWVNEEPQKPTILNYVDLLVKKTEGTSEIIDKCIASDVSDDFCDHLFNVYKCFWNETMSKLHHQVHENHDFNFETANENELKKESR